MSAVLGMIRKHGEQRFGITTPEYSAYQNAKARCCTPSSSSYMNYGARGIEFRFLSFPEFLGVLGRRPTRVHTLDRINNDGHYEKGNVRWSTRVEQSRNRRPSSEWKYCAVKRRNAAIYAASFRPKAVGKLTPSEVRAIRRSDKTQRELAQQYKVCQATISRARNGRSPGPEKLEGS